MRPRREILTAVASAAAVVVATALLVWLLRPGPSSRFDGGGGGLFNRQPRASWLVALSAMALGAWIWWVLTRRHRRSVRVLLGAGGAVVVTGAVVAGFVWPGGLLRQYLPPPRPFDPAELEEELADITSTTAAVPDASSTTTPGTETSVAPPDPTTEGTAPAP